MAQKVCLYFQVHQPERVKPFDFFAIGSKQTYFNDDFNKEIIEKVSRRCYLPANKLFQRLLARYPEQLKLTYSISGVALEQFEKWQPQVISSFQDLVKTEQVELLSETYYHSLSIKYSEYEFVNQVKLHREKIVRLFSCEPCVFRNTELIYTPDLISKLTEFGFDGVLAEGLELPKAGSVFYVDGAQELPVVYRDFNRSDELAFRFSDKNWSFFPLKPQQYIDWIKEEEREVVNVFIDYETIGEHHQGNAIFDFFETFITDFIAQGGEFVTPSEQIKEGKPSYLFSIVGESSWADKAKDLSAWEGNEMQKEALKKVFELEKLVRLRKNKKYESVFSKLLTSDHFYYMSTKVTDDGEVHSYFSPYNSPYDAYVFFMNILADFELKLTHSK